MDNGHFRPNDTYNANRRLILSSLPSNVTSQEGLFFNGSIGQEPNRVYATGMCIPGSNPQDCSDCIKLASDGLLQSCPNQTNAFTWLGDPTLCLVRYASTSFSGSGDLTPRRMVTNGGYIASNKTEFKKTWEDLVARMIDVASTGKSTPLFSNNHYTANSAALTSSQNMYALMQCTPDVSSRDCENCLRQSANDFHSCCALKRGTRILRPVCFFRWELYDYSTASFAANFTVASSSPPHLPPVVVPEPADDQDNTIDTADSDISTPHSSQYDFKSIEVATNKFSRSNKLGEGGFGEVYKGMLSNGTEVAVKRLSEKSGQGIREFKNEAVLVSKLLHRNLVRLLGFCLEGEEKILIYEFVPNKSLDYFLFDFGLSTIFEIDQTQGNTSKIAGTYAYMSPEYAMQGQFSMKSDIYSFGVLVFEIISGKKNSGLYQMDKTSNAGNLVNNAWRLWRNVSPLELVDPAIGRNYQTNEVTRCIHIALLCVQDNPDDRPMLSTIILMLTSNTITLPLPRLPNCFPHSMNKLDQLSEGCDSSQFTGQRSVGYSGSDMTISDLEPR
uniref:Cysteine-rich receptor-like protein kinase n=1 Tax=Brassica campestris TaxID=3711 RepID=M4DAZ7_BRACM